MNPILQDIKDSTSLDNLKKARPQAQIATLLILIITALLIFTLITVNIGQISSYATRLANAADSASLLLASQIGTKSYRISDALQRACNDTVRCCKRTGALSRVLAIVVAIVAMVVFYYFPPGGVVMLTEAGAFTAAGAAIMIGAGVIGGAAGGAIGGGWAGTGAAQGAIQGAMIGAAIAGGVVGGAAIGAGYAGPGAQVVPNIAGGPGAAPLFSSLEGFTLVGGSSLAAPAAVVGTTLAAASSIYNAYVADAMTGASMASAAKAFSGLPEYQRMRESVFLQALSQTIDDPNKVADSIDSDGDGDTTELVTNFQVCWDKRITWIKDNNGANIGAARNAVNNFLNGSVATFQQAINNFRRYLRREGIEPQCVDSNGEPIPCGEIVELLRALNDRGYASFWKPGPSRDELTAWRNSWDPLRCPTCEPPDPPISQGYDELDYVIDELGDFGRDINDLRSQNMDNLVYNWRYWVSRFYDPDDPDTGSDPDDYYHAFYNLINGDSSSVPARLGLRAWIDEIERLRSRLPVCEFGNYEDRGFGPECVLSGADSGECVSNPPCRGSISNPSFGTIDEDAVDEFRIAKQAINDFIPSIDAFRQACLDIYNTMLRLMEPIQQNIPPMACGLTGINPVTYNWRDSRGNHSISVEVGNFQMPYVRSSRRGNWLKGRKCIHLVHHTQNVTVNIERHDPTQVAMGVLGKWNPSAGGIIRRRSTAQYKGLALDSGYVRIVGR